MTREFARRLRQAASIVIWPVAAWIPLDAQAQTATERIKQCLSGFDGIVWQFPYAPKLGISDCVTPAGTLYKTNRQPVERKISLVIASSFDLFYPRTYGSSNAFADQHQAVYVFFDALFRSNGFTSDEIEHEDASGASYVKRATWTRQYGGALAVLTLEITFANGWDIILSGLPDQLADEATGS